MSFMEQDLKTPLSRVFMFICSTRIEELAKRGGADWTIADRQAIEHGIAKGRGGIWLNLSPNQYAKLKP